MRTNGISDRDNSLLVSLALGPNIELTEIDEDEAGLSTADMIALYCIPKYSSVGHPDVDTEDYIEADGEVSGQYIVFDQSCNYLEFPETLPSETSIMISDAGQYEYTCLALSNDNYTIIFQRSNLS
ncbi:hypothetical protein ADUPG1_011601 [Aduncisulcus paluster]|uniref:Uncharacterized protein n=1 Tax=Aduncisulcus paluster TaxID=2918883 RepID=A0ABQ5JWC9_9EUKA|nr:hypothetical protein ADUPG1_011601 [Aduncisulcus paluster]